VPCLPKEWSGFKIHYRYRDTLYHIEVRNGGVGTRVNLVVTDGEKQPDGLIQLTDDRHDHHVQIDVE
jgi:cellobiose phosphorylase